MLAIASSENEERKRKRELAEKLAGDQPRAPAKSAQAIALALTWIVNTRSPLCGAAKDLKEGATCKSGKECNECIPPACK